MLTLPPESEEQRPQPQHICRPSIQSHNSSGSLACVMEKENAALRKEIEELQAERDRLRELLNDKEEDIETLKRELRMKDDIVTQLEKDFERMEIEVIDLQKVRESAHWAMTSLIVIDISIPQFPGCSGR